MFISSELYDRVRDVLTKHPETRDSDFLLQWHLWEDRLPKDLFGNIRMQDFKELFISGKLPNTKSVERYRRILEHAHPELKGTCVGKRKKNQVKVKNHVKALKKQVA